MCTPAPNCVKLVFGAGLNRAIIGMIVAEMFTAITGLGGAIVLYSNTYRTDRLFVAVIILSLSGIVLSSAIRGLERVVMPWRTAN